MPAIGAREVDAEGAAGIHLVRRGAAFLGGHGARVGGLVGTTLAVAGLNALDPLVLKLVVDGLAGDGGLELLGRWLGVLLLIAVLRESAGAVANWLAWRIRVAVHFELLGDTVAKIHSLPLDFHRQEGVGGLMTRLDRSISGFLQALQDILTNVLPSVLYLAISIVVMVQLDLRLTLLVLAFAPLPPLIGLWAAPEQTRRESLLLERWVRIYSRFNEVLTGIVTVRSFVREDAEKRRFLEGVAEANRVVVRGIARDTGLGAARNLVAGLARVAALALGGWLVVRGEVTVGTLVAFLGYVGGLFGPVEGLTNVYQTLRRATVSLRAIFGILDREDTLGDAPDAVTLTSVRGEVVFDDVHFSYRPEAPLLRGVGFRVSPGETVAIVGPSGSGKSTLMALLQRLYDPSAGRILVDGLDIRGIRQRSLRGCMGVVLQEPLLFDDPVRDNIAYGRPEASLAEIEAAARAANAHDFILRLPAGYDTPAGERGTRLSVGERQRIAIARMLLKDPGILVLDEPTASLDAESEHLVQQALARLTSGRTTLVIAHRLVTVVGADRIVVLKEGRIVEAGGHASLMAQGGYYASLVERQVKGLLPDVSVAAWSEWE